MGRWRRQRGEIHEREVQATRSHSRKPPTGNWQPTVPSWEKKFCACVGSIPWQKLLETKRYMHLYDNVVQWDDSACQEAFNNAKKRFWAEINNLPCDISLPDPDIYIDEVDWNAIVDPELLLDLEREAKIPDEKDKEDKGVTLCSSLPLNQSVPCTGWGDAEDEKLIVTDNSLVPQWGGIGQNVNNNGNMWEYCWDQNPGPWKDYNWNDSGGWHQQEYNPAPNWGSWDRSGRKEESPSWQMSRYKTSRFQGDDRGWKNGRGQRRGNYVCGQPFLDKPVTHRGSAKAGNAWSFEKSVL